MTAQPFAPLRSCALTRLAHRSSRAGTATSLLRWARKGGITVAGIAVMAAGVAMLVLPGPGVAVILLGLAVLASEYDWAARLLAALRQRVTRMASPLTERLRRKRPTEATG